jgi:glutamate N-acetyltransferase/amino-acid N-acetyltransferase
MSQREYQAATGFRVAGIAAGLKSSGARDMALIVSEQPAVAAGIFTTNLVQAAPVQFDRAQLACTRTGYRAVVVNTRCANACTGERGLADATEMAAHTARALGIHASQVLVLSTGVIGTFLPMPAIARGIERAAAQLGTDWRAAAEGIMTTDTRPKLASAELVQADGRSYRITGIAKGAGMIAPSMATMLSIIVTDAVMPPDTAQMCLSAAAETTFNRIVVDGDMSTNDTVLLLANSASGVTAGDEFLPALTQVARDLATAVVRDGEGVTKFITLTVTGAPDDAQARQVAAAIATSPLVKTAFYGGDANWGRIMAAAGRAGVSFDADAAQLRIAVGEDGAVDGLLLFERGMPTAYDEDQAKAIVAAAEISVALHLGAGDGATTVYTCDLSHEYVSINGHYRS